MVLDFSLLEVFQTRCSDVLFRGRCRRECAKESLRCFRLSLLGASTRPNGRIYRRNLRKSGEGSRPQELQTGRSFFANAQRHFIFLEMYEMFVILWRCFFDTSRTQPGKVFRRFSVGGGGHQFLEFSRVSEGDPWKLTELRLDMPDIVSALRVASRTRCGR
jgi:hypothetical protein